MTELLASVVMPVRNEARHIEDALTAVLEQDVPDGALEVLVVDGKSEDATRAIVSRLAEGARFHVRLLDNPRRIAATALNVGFAAAACDVVVRVDGHCAIPQDYVRRLLEVLARTGAAAAGGSVSPVGRGATGEAIAKALRHPLAQGGADWRSGDGEEREVDTVPFPAYRKDAVLAVGGFDEVLVRNQDDDLHMRLREAGERIVLVPDLVATYQVRPSMAALRRQYFEYGMWKAIRWIRTGSLTSRRALAPALYVLALGVATAVGGAAAIALGVAEGFGLLAAAAFVAPPLVVSMLHMAAVAVAVQVWAPEGYFAPPEHRGVEILEAIRATHLHYGLGFWWGVLRLGRPPRRRP